MKENILRFVLHVNVTALEYTSTNKSFITYRNFNFQKSISRNDVKVFNIDICSKFVIIVSDHDLYFKHVYLQN